MPLSTPIADPIVITTSRAPQAEDQSPASVTVIDGTRIERLGDPLVATLLRLTPSVSVTTQGPAGSFTEVRIRGAENTHTLLFIDGIRTNDPASGDFARFELLNADLASRVEVVRGPQSALWGSDAIGGVIAVNGLDDPDGIHAAAESGSFGFHRLSAGGGLTEGGLNLSGAIGWQRARGIDSFGALGGDKDGYSNLSGRLRIFQKVGSAVKIGASALALTGRSEFDGYDPVTFEHTDTFDNSRNRLVAGRLWAAIGEDASPWSSHVSASLLRSSNRNDVADDPVNRTRGQRRVVDAQLERAFSVGAIDQRLIVAIEHEHENFTSRDTIYGGLTDQDQSRDHQSITGEWRAEHRGTTLDVALRHDHFNRFRGATTVRASALVPVGTGFALAASYGEGIAPPTFFDLYGFFPGNFVGNPSLKPERSKGFEGGLRYRRGAVAASLTAYRQRLSDEIVDVFDPLTFLQTSANSDSLSHRWGIEAGAEWQVVPGLRLSANYAYLRATQPDSATGRQVTEARRPKHSGSIAADGSKGRWSYGGSIAYVGHHRDIRDNFPYGPVSLAGYWLAGARVGYRVHKAVEVYARGSNLFDAHYEDSFGYHTEGRGLYLGVRLADPRSLP